VCKPDVIATLTAFDLHRRHGFDKRAADQLLDKPLAKSEGRDIDDVRAFPLRFGVTHPRVNSGLTCDETSLAEAIASVGVSRKSRVVNVRHRSRRRIRNAQLQFG
jgi:hypothetical protein